MIIGPDGPAPRRWGGCRRLRSWSLEASHDLRCRRHYRSIPTTNYLRWDSGSVPWGTDHAYCRCHYYLRTNCLRSDFSSVL
jgi:hypothetical protein